MTTLNDIQKQLAEQLLLSILKKEPTVNYSELAERVSPPMNPRNVGHNIGQVSLLCHELGLPLLSAKVINKNTGSIGEGFFPLYKMMGIPTEGKSEKELFHEELKAIRTCDEWYKLEDYLGLHVGMPRPSGAPASLLNAQRPIAYAKSVDVLNACFGERILGKKYGAWQRGALEFPRDGVVYTVWFPKLSEDGDAASGSGWVNRISPNGMTIEETGGSPYTGYTGERLVFAKKGNEPYKFCGVFAQDKKRSTPSRHFYEKVADIADFSGDVPAIQYFSDEADQDRQLLDLMNNDAVSSTEITPQHRGKALPVPEPLQSGNRIVYPRNRQTAENALAFAHYRCEIDPTHPFFIRRNADVPYMEPHHLVPLSMQRQFDVSLDVEENIVSLCSNCHNHIHYGKGAKEMIKTLYEQRRTALESVGIRVTLDELLSFYA